MKKYLFEVKDKNGKILFKCESDSASYIMRRRNREMYSSDNYIYSRYFNALQLVNGTEDWEYDRTRDEFLWVPERR